MNDHYTAWQILQASLRLDLIEAYIAREITLAELAQSAELSPVSASVWLNVTVSQSRQGCSAAVRESRAIIS